jgi:hypothetical protein
MNFKDELVTSIDIEVFERLYNDSKKDFESGTYPWHLYPNIISEEARKTHIYSTLLTLIENGIVWVRSIDDYPILMGGGIIEGAKIKYVLGLVGYKDGSKSWLYHEGNRGSRDALWQELGVDGYIMGYSGNFSSIANHVSSRMANYNGGSYGINTDSKHALFKTITVTKTS